MRWTFQRADERVSIARWQAAEASVLVIATPGRETRRYRFTEVAKLMSFQRDMEVFLLNTGWTLLKFSPERRRGRDRRRTPRTVERRRWWTDSAETSKAVWGG
jgi:hypothetical protein